MKLRKSEVALDFLMTYGWFMLLLVIAIIAFFVVLEKKSQVSEPDIDVVVDSEPELWDICNKLVVNNEVYPFLEVMGNGLRKANGANFIIYKTPAELNSNLDIFNVDGMILCAVPAELCYTENNDIEGGTYCLMMKLEVPVRFQDFSKWYLKVSGVLLADIGG